MLSNRGPNEYVREGRRWHARTARGGLVSLLRPLFRHPSVLWLACAMSDAEREFAASADEPGLASGDVVPEEGARFVTPDPDDFREYYATFANELLWPVQHGLWAPGADVVTRRHFAAWDAYRRVNQAFAEAVEGNEPWVLVQDYQLYLVPGFLRRLKPRARILHFTHIPWPPLRSWDAIPRHFVREFFESLVSADVVGLQTHADVDYFLAGVRGVLPGAEIDWRTSTVEYEGRTVRVRAYPASGDFDAIVAAGARSAQIEAGTSVAPRLGDRTVLRVDRLDPSKNQLLGFEAFRELLRLEPERLADTRMLACLVPSRTDVGRYRDYRDAVYRRVGEVNEEFEAETEGRPPISVLYMDDRRQAMHAMQNSEVLLANSVADGMNLVVKEALILGKQGIVPVVSRTAGVTEELGEWVIEVGASDIHGTARALSRALAMPEEERRRRAAEARRYLRNHDLGDWITRQLRDLVAAASER